MSDTTSLADLTATAAAAAMDRLEISSKDLVEACLARIEACEGQVHAFAHLDPAHALAQAKTADEVRRTGRGVGPLHGVPVAVKDIVDTADLPTENGFPAAFAGRRPAKDAFLVSQLRAAGAVIIGKTVSSPLASPGDIKTRNPHDPTRQPGTSSSGSAAAVAAGMVPLAIGTQTAGSVIRPASFCGTCGFKPTFGTVSRRGALLQSETLDTIGVLARSVEDLALATDAMSAHDPDDPVSFVRSRPSLRAMAREPVPVPPLFAFVRSPFWDTSGGDVKAAFGELLEALGPQVQEVELVTLGDLLERQREVMCAEAAVRYRDLFEKHRDAMSGETIASQEKGRALSSEAYRAALATAEPAYRMFEDILGNYTAVLTMSADSVAPPMHAPFTPNVNGIWTFLGMPAVSLPLLEIDGLPLGVQLIGLRHDDGRLLRTARWLTDHVVAQI